MSLTPEEMNFKLDLDLTRQTKFVNGIRPGITVGQAVDFAAAQYPNRDAVVIDGIRKTWSEYVVDINKLTAHLLSTGLKKGDIIALWSQNNYPWMVAWFACAKIGLIIVPLDHWFQVDEANYILSHSEAKAVICTANYLSLIDKMQNIGKLTHLVLMDTPGSLDELLKTKTPALFQISNFVDILSRPLDENSISKINTAMSLCHGNDVCFILYTSGTTGTPKGAMLSHNNVIQDMMEISKALQADETDAYLIPVVFSHCFGNSLGITMATITASKMVPLKDQTPSIALKAIVDERCSIVHGTPTHFIRYIRELKEHPNYDISCLRTGVTAGAPCPPRVMKDIMTTFHLPGIVNAYGETEVSPIMTLTRVTDPLSKRLTTVGRLFEGVEGKVVDDDNHDLGIEEIGEICCRGWNVMSGYYKDPERTAQTIDKNGWLHTGDLGKIDKDGYFQITGRKKDMIIYGGANVYPKTIEDVLLKHPKVLECAIVGIPDEEYGEVVGCVAKIKDGLTEQELVDYCYGKVSTFSIPRYVRFDVPLPLSGRGKVQKFKLREELIEMKKANKLGEKYVPTEIQKKKLEKTQSSGIQYNRKYGKELVDKYLKNSDLDLLASDLKLLDHSYKAGELCYELALQIQTKNPEFARIIDPECVGFLGYVHNIGYSIQNESHELHTVYLLTKKENVPEWIALKTKHGYLVEKYADKVDREWKDYYPVGLEGILLTYIDFSLRKGDIIPVKDRATEILNYIQKTNKDPKAIANISENLQKALPRYQYYETLINNLLNRE
jgi:fatty-acyl-CoA synthase